jgi:Protein of unknown function (DUF3800)
MAIFCAYFDESGKHKDHPVVTFTGVCAWPAKIQLFDDAWNALLNQYGLRSLHMKAASRLSKKLCEKMPGNQTADQRIEALKPFADCINKHLEVGLIQAWDVKGFNAMSKDARAKLGNVEDPYFLAFARGVSELVEYVREEDRIALICDDDRDTAWDGYRHYRGIKAADEEIRKKTISLGFADDDYFPALQAADMAGFLARHEARRYFYGIPATFSKLFDYMIERSASGPMVWKTMFC